MGCMVCYGQLTVRPGWPTMEPPAHVVVRPPMHGRSIYHPEHPRKNGMSIRPLPSMKQARSLVVCAMRTPGRVIANPAPPRSGRLCLKPCGDVGYPCRIVFGSLVGCWGVCWVCGVCCKLALSRRISVCPNQDIPHLPIL